MKIKLLFLIPVNLNSTTVVYHPVHNLDSINNTNTEHSPLIGIIAIFLTILLIIGISSNIKFNNVSLSTDTINNNNIKSKNGTLEIDFTNQSLTLKNIQDIVKAIQYTNNDNLYLNIMPEYFQNTQIFNTLQNYLNLNYKKLIIDFKQYNNSNILYILGELSRLKLLYEAPHIKILLGANYNQVINYYNQNQNWQDTFQFIR